MSAARRLLPWVVAAALAVPGAASAQGDGPDVPAGPGSVLGRLLHETRPEAAANIDVILYALTPDGGGGLRRSRTDADGRFRFEDVSNEPTVAYLVGARAGDIPFGSRFSFAPGETEHRVEVTVSDPIADAGAAVAGAVDVRVERGCTHLRVSQSHTLTNPGTRVIFVPEAARDDAQPIFEAVMPEGAEGFEAMLGREGIEREGRRVRFWGPLYPGPQQVEFGYGLAMATGRIEIALPGGAPALNVFAPEEVLALSSERLSPAPPTLIDEQPYTTQRVEALAPGSSIALAVSLPERAPSEIRTPRAELWLELDDAALEVNERLEVVVDAAGGVPESLGEPLLCIPLPAGALELRFSNEILSAGLRRDPSGDLAVHGPLPSGPTLLAVRYRLPASGAGADLLRRYDRDLPLLSVLVADNGVVAETTRLHRRRAVRSDDRMFLHLEAFGIEALEPIALGLRRTPPRDGAGRWASAGFAALAGLASLGFLAAPLRGDSRAVAAAPEPDRATLERETFARALEDLDDDLETGKVSPEDHAAMRAELRARAAAALLRPPEAEAVGAGHPASPPSPPAADPAAKTCPGCGAGAAPEARFCSQCGSALHCASCGSAIRADDVYCSQCGNKHGARVPQA